MFKKWVTVIYWHNGYAIVQDVFNSSCNECFAYSIYEFLISNKKILKTKYQLELPISQPLIINQKVQIGILNNSLLRLMLILYLTPLISFFVAGSIVNFFFLNQLVIFLTAILGLGIGIFIAKKIIYFLEKKNIYQPVILQIGDLLLIK